MIKLLHFADLHLGVENYGRIDPATGLSTRLMDFLRAYHQVVDHALEKDVSLVIFAGDAYYRTCDPNSTYQREFAKGIQRFSAAGIPTVLVPGNHDTPRAAHRATTIDIFATLEVANIHVATRPQVIHIDTKDGPVQVATLPWATRSGLLARKEYKNKSLEEIGQVMLEKIVNIVKGPGGLISQLDPAVPTILAGHGTFQGSVYGSERSVMLGQDLILPLTLVQDSVFDYVALGHLHRYQILSREPLIIYSGSTGRLDFGEEGQDKGFVLVEIERGRATHEFIKTDTLRFVTVELTVQTDDPTTEVLEAIAAHEIEGAVVRVIIHLTPEKEPLLNTKAILRALAGAFRVASIATDVERKVRLRLDPGDDQDIEQMPPHQMLRQYFQAKGTAPERTKVLLECADEIFQELE